MYSLFKLEKQHLELKRIIENFCAQLQNEITKSKSVELANFLIVISKKINLHLILEDKILYPNLNNHSDIKINQKSKMFMEEMGSIKKEFGLYFNRWGFSTNIDSNPNDFINESHDIFDALSNRIKREEEELFPLLTL